MGLGKPSTHLVVGVDALPLDGRRPVTHDHVDDAHAAGQQHARVGLSTPRVQSVHLSLGKCAAAVWRCGKGAAKVQPRYSQGAARAQRDASRVHRGCIEGCRQVRCVQSVQATLLAHPRHRPPLEIRLGARSSGRRGRGRSREGGEGESAATRRERRRGCRAQRCGTKDQPKHASQTRRQDAASVRNPVAPMVVKFKSV